MFATYSVPGTDIVFACVLFMLCMALAFVVGRVLQLQTIKDDVHNLRLGNVSLCKKLASRQEDIRYVYGQWSDSNVQLNSLWEGVLKNQRLGMTKKHREAMKRYKAKCDAQLSKQISMFMASTDDLK